MERKMATNDIKFHVHVVNSVKGGSGKSTFSLLLADHFVRNHEEAYVIDLDLCGTSWYSDFAGCWEEKEPVFINEIMYAPFSRGFSFNAWSHLKVNDPVIGGTGFGPRKINVCIAAKDQADQLCDMPEVELLEHTTYHLIRDVMLIQQKSKTILKKGYDLVIQSYKMSSLLTQIAKHINEVQQLDPNRSTNWNKVCELLSNAAANINKEAGYLRTLLTNFLKSKTTPGEEYDEAEKNLQTQMFECLHYVGKLVQDTNMIEKKPLPTRKCRGFSNIPLLDYKYDSNTDFDSTYDQTIKVVEKAKIDCSSLENEIRKMIEPCQRDRDIATSSVTHFILDLPPSHDTTVEQICHRLLFDNNSPLNKDKNYRGKFKVSFYMMSPVDQPSAYKKNKAYIQNLVYNNRRYSSSICSFINPPDKSNPDDTRLKICFVIIDNHGWEEMDTSRKGSTSVDTLQKNEYSHSENDTIIKSTKSVLAFLPFMRFEFKKSISVFYQPAETADNGDLNIASLEHTAIADIVNKTT